jgi:large subunit ribosomal protein L13
MAKGQGSRAVVVFDADGLVLGRAATHIAKRLLSEPDSRVVVINAEKALITGSSKSIEALYHLRRTRGSERKGPFYPTRPERIFKRAVRGMLPFKKDRGRQAFKRLKCYNGVPKEFAGAKAERPKDASQIRTARYVTLAHVASSIGPWKPLQ